MSFVPRVLQPDRSPRDLFGSDVRRYREKMGWSLAQLAEILNFSKAHLSRIECAESPPPEGLAEELDRVFGTDGHFARLYPLVRNDVFPDWFRRFNGLAERAVVRESFSLAIHGLLQTAEYAEALFRAAAPFAPDGEIAQLVAARLARQKALHLSSPARYWFILDEGALRRPVGGPVRMCAQLERILTTSQLPHVTIQVLPFSAGEHPEMDISLTLLTMADGMRYAWEEGGRSGVLLDDKEIVARRYAGYDHLRAQALAPRDSAAMISAALEDLRHAARREARPVAEEQLQHPSRWRVHRGRRRQPRPGP